MFWFPSVSFYQQLSFLVAPKNNNTSVTQKSIQFSVWSGCMDRGGIPPVMKKYGCGLGGDIFLAYAVKTPGNILNFLFCVSILKMLGACQLHACSLPLYFVLYTQLSEVPCPKCSDYIICLTSLWVPLPLGTSCCKACFGSVLVLFSMTCLHGT